MVIRCPGCLTRLMVDEEGFQDKVLLKCPECLYIFLIDEKYEQVEYEAKSRDEELGEATLLVSDIKPEGDLREFQWNVPGPSLTVMQGPNQGVHFKIEKDRMVIGRENSDLNIPDQAISRRHAEIKKKDGWFLIRDLGSKNGTFVNGEQVDEAKLMHLDEIRIGETHILFCTMAAESNVEDPDASSERDAIAGQERTDVDSEAAEKPLPLPPRRSLFLEVMQGQGKGRSIPLLSGRVIIGRGDEADIKIEDVQISRKHALIEAFSRDQIFITDLASQNSTYLNGIRIRTTKLKHSDLLRLGNTVLKFIVVDMPEN